jgi:glutathione S-transferase
VDGGQLPAIEKDNELITESIDIIKRLDDDFPGNGPRIIPLVSSPEANMAQDLLQLERELQSAWFSLVFYPVEGPALLKARQNFLGMIALVDDALATTPGPWFLGGTSPSFVDIQFVCHVERIIASVLYFKGIQLVGKYPKLDAWLTAWDDRPSYLATKSDFYTLIMSIPSQNGPGYSIPEAKLVASQICGLEGAWDFPIHNNEKDRQEAAFCLMSNHEVIVTFATRGAGESGRPSFQAELADPYAEPNLEFLSSVDICLRYVTEALLDGSEVVEARAARVLVGNAGDGTLRPDWYEYSDNDGRRYWWNEETGDATWTAPTMQLDSCLAYLRDRIGVPRDMSEGAAMQLRAYLNWGIDLLNRTS